jgi:predicted transcriptional regulator
MPTQREVQVAIDPLEKDIRDQFAEMVASVVGATTIVRVVSALNSVDGVVDEAGISRPAMNDLLESIRDTYKAGGKFEAPQARIRFDYRNVAAETWLRDHSSQFVTRVQNQQREAIRLVLESGTRLGRNPRQTALDIVGRIDATGRRRGGIVGLTDQQAGYAARAREQLLSGNTGQMRDYLTRQRRDRRFDKRVLRAIEAGKPVTQIDTDRIVGRYNSRLLSLRGESIARTESLEAFNVARDQAWEQAVNEGVIQRQNVTKTWRSGGDLRVRNTHSAMNGQKIDKDSVFISPSGARLMHPGDTSLGAGAEEIVMCRCIAQYKGDFVAEAR